MANAFFDSYRRPSDIQQPPLISFDAIPQLINATPIVDTTVLALTDADKAVYTPVSATYCSVVLAMQPLNTLKRMIAYMQYHNIILPHSDYQTLQQVEDRATPYSNKDLLVRALLKEHAAILFLSYCLINNLNRKRNRNRASEVEQLNAFKQNILESCQSMLNHTGDNNAYARILNQPNFFINTGKDGEIYWRQPCIGSICRPNNLLPLSSYQVERFLRDYNRVTSPSKEEREQYPVLVFLCRIFRSNLPVSTINWIIRRDAKEEEPISQVEEKPVGKEEVDYLFKTRLK